MINVEKKGMHIFEREKAKESGEVGGGGGGGGGGGVWC